MKTNKFWSIMMMLTLVLGTAITFSSCGDDDKDEVNNTIIIPQDPIVDGINAALIPGMYEFNGNIAPSFILYRDGTCDIQNNGLSGDITKDKWSYEKTTHILMVGTHVYNVKLLTKDKLAAEWTSVKYGTSLSSWKRTELPAGGSTVNVENGHEYVDLGLSVKWATMNVGANKPEGYGWYLAWGETKPRSGNVYTLDSYKWYDTATKSITKYRVTTSQVSVDGRKFLEPEDDAAHVNWGGTWRMPTLDEIGELMSPRYCTWTWTTQNGVNGYRVISLINGNCIFLPAAGSCNATGLSNAGTVGYYWSSKLDKENEFAADGILINSAGHSYYSSYRYRFIGQSVRAVCP